MKKVTLFFALLIFTCLSCNRCFVNQETSRIFNLNTECECDSAWIELKKSHSITNITDSTLRDKLIDFKDMPFPNEVYYFDGAAPELIAISTDHDCVRYLYNPLLSDKILDGLSPELSNSKKDQVGEKIQSFLRKFQCSDERSHRYHQEWDE
jgi:hypothetical protein